MVIDHGLPVMPHRPQNSTCSESASRGAIGAYGLRLTGIESARDFLVAAPPQWPIYEVERRAGRAPSKHNLLNAELAEVALGENSSVVIEREKARAVFTMPELPTDWELIHPYLAAVGAIVAHWHGRESFHAGAFVADGGVWALLGEREAGKSSTLAWLALQGYEIFCDDVLILEGTTALAGPRSVDLRAEAAERLAADELFVVARKRWRLPIGPVEAELPLRGWVFLRWGDRVELVSVSASERLAQLTRHLAVSSLPNEPETLLELAGVRGWELRRPRGWSSLDDSTRELIEAIKDCRAAA